MTIKYEPWITVAVALHGFSLPGDGGRKKYYVEVEIETDPERESTKRRIIPHSDHARRRIRATSQDEWERMMGSPRYSTVTNEPSMIVLGGELYRDF